MRKAIKINSWSLNQIDIENFKAINNASLTVDPGFTVITGPNGCGKSCFLESVGFGLGASLAELRVNNLADLCSNDRPGQRVRVLLKFTNGVTSVTVGSSIIDGTRLYLVGNVKVTKIKFTLLLTETLGFSKDSISWNISQRAVENITKATPKKLFDTLCFIAGTHSVLEARNLANQQIAQSESQLESVAGVIKKLEEDIESERLVLQLMNERDEVTNALRDAERGRELGENAYEAAKKCVSLTAAAAIIVEILDAKYKEVELLTRLSSNHDMKGKRNEESSARDIARQPSHLEACRMDSTIAARAVIEAQSSIMKHNKLTMKLHMDMAEQDKLEADSEEKLKACETEAAGFEREQRLLLEVSIPQQCIRISALELRMQSAPAEGAHLAPSDAAAVISNKNKELRSAVEVCKLSESLLMAVSATASQAQSGESGLKARLQRAMRDGDALKLEYQALLNSGRQNMKNGDVKDWEGFYPNHFQTLQRELQSLQQQLQSLRWSLHLPNTSDVEEGPPLQTTTSSSISGSSSSSSNSSSGRVGEDGDDSGDLGYLADLLHFSFSLDGNSSHGGRNKDSDRGSRYAAALDAILGYKLSVRVCRDGEAAERLMRGGKRQGQSMRIWPAENLVTATSRPPEYLEILRRYPAAVDPLSLVSLVETAGSGASGEGGASTHRGSSSEALKRVLFKAVESWVIVDDDETAGRIVGDKNQLCRLLSGCVTLQGNKHTLGSLTVGSRREGQISQVQLQVDYKRLTLRQWSIGRELESYQRHRKEGEEQERQQHRLGEVQALLMNIEGGLGDIEEAVDVQTARAVEAQRELTVARLKLMEAERHRDTVREELSVLGSSSGVERMCVARAQEAANLHFLLQQRDSMEGKVSALLVYSSESKSLISRLRDSRAVAGETKAVLGQQAAGRAQLLSHLQGALLECERNAATKRDILHSCEELHAEQGRQEAAACNEIEAMKETVADKIAELSAVFLKYGQSALAARYSASKINNSYGGEAGRKVSGGGERGKRGDGGMGKQLLQELRGVEESIADMVGDGQLHSLREKPEQYLTRARVKVVEGREEVDRLALEISRVQAALKRRLKGLGRGGNDDVAQSSRADKGKGKGGSGSDTESDSDDEMAAASRHTTHRSSGSRKIRGKEKEKVLQQEAQGHRQRLSEGTHRKSSLLSTVKQKYAQIQLSIAALAGGAQGVEGAIGDLHSSTYKELRERCQRYFSDLVPGRSIDLLPFSADGVLDFGLKFVLLSDKKDATMGSTTGGEEGKSMKRESIESDSEEEEEKGAGGGDKTNSSRQCSTSSCRKHKRRGQQRSTEELSGGQRALLGLSFVFAAALHKHSPLYLLDEVDAALDETNQQTVGAVIAKIFQSSQVVCVSHHSCFQDQADSVIPVSMREGHSRVGHESA